MQARPVAPFPKFWSGNSSAANPNDGDRWVYNSATGLWEPKAMTTRPVFASSHVGHSLTGTVTETELWAATIPGRTLGANGALCVTVMWYGSNNTNLKTVKVKYGGSTISNIGVSSTFAVNSQVILYNKNTEAEQTGFYSDTPTSYGAVGVPPTTYTIDTSADQQVAITGKLANSGDTISLKAVMVEVLR